MGAFWKENISFWDCELITQVGKEMGSGGWYVWLCNAKPAPFVDESHKCTKEWT